MKKYIGIVIIVLVTSIGFAQTPPPPNNGTTSGGGNTPVGGGAPVGSGLMVLIAAAGVYGYIKFNGKTSD